MNRRFRAVLTALLATAGACDSSTGPGPDVPPEVEVRVTGNTGAMTTTRETDGSPRAQCPVTLTATATGRGGQPAHWQGARLYRYYGLERRAPTDTTFLTQAELAQAWGSPSIAPAEARTATWSFGASSPFTGMLELHYTDTRGADGVVSYTFTCGPTPPEGGVPAPTVTDFQVRSEGAVVGERIRPGSELQLTYTGKSGAGVWETGVLISGAFTARVRFAEGLSATSTRSTTILVPANADRTQPIRMTAYAIDPFLQVTTGPAGQLQVTEQFPPILSGATLGPNPPTGAVNELKGEFAGGDTIRLQVTAREPRDVNWVVYTLRGAINVRDSVAAVPGRLVQDLRIPVRADWAGATSFSVQLRNAAGEGSNVLTSPAGGFQVLASSACDGRACPA